MYERRHEVPDVEVVNTVHDEIVLECDRVTAARALAWALRCAEDGMRPILKDVVKPELEGTARSTWWKDDKITD